MIKSIHSIAGGVGKTTLAYKLVKQLDNSILIDFNLIGCGIANLHNPKKYLNDYIFNEKCNELNINDFIFKGNIDALIADPSIVAINKVVPLLAQEENLHFFESRMNTIIKNLDYENIIIDTHPGFFGISKGIAESIESLQNSESIMICNKPFKSNYNKMRFVNEYR